MEDVTILLIGGAILFGVLVLFFVIPVVLMRWIFRINEQIELLNQIRDELKKLRLRKYPENRKVEP